MSDNSKPYAWLKKVPGAIKQADTIPLLGDPPPFPWENLSQDIQKLLELQSLEIAPSEFVWLEEGAATKGMGSPLCIIPFSIASLEGGLFLAVPESDIAKMMDILLLKGNKLAPIDDQFQTAFLDFITLEVLNTIQQIGYAPEFMPKLHRDGKLPSSPLLGMDITVNAEGFRSVFRLLITPEMNQSLKEHYAKNKEASTFKRDQAEQIDVILNVEAGKTSLTQKQWKEVKPGDYILLDRCSLNPGDNSGTVTLTLRGHPILRANIEDGNIKILENPLFREDN